MARRIEKLTRKQEALLAVKRDEWLAYGLSTEPADRVTAEAGVAAAYHEAGLEPPKIVVWLRSPLEGAIGTWMVQQIPTKPEKTTRVKKVRGQVGDQVGGQVRGQVWGQVWDQVGDQVWDQVRGQVWGQVGDLLSYNSVIWGQHDAGSWSWLDTFRELGIDACERTRGLCDVGKSAGWWWPLDGAVVLTDRPSELYRDTDGRLHNDNGPAVRYRDEWCVYAIHGVRVSQQVIEHPDTLTVSQVRDETNAEIRRIMINRFPAQRYLVEAGSKVVATDDWGTLHRLPVAGDEDVVMVECVNSTLEADGSEKVYWLRVPPDSTSPVEALGWTFDLPVEEYRSMAAAS
jgi:hypothetical protein